MAKTTRLTVEYDDSADVVLGAFVEALKKIGVTIEILPDNGDPSIRCVLRRRPLPKSSLSTRVDSADSVPGRTSFTTRIAKDGDTG